MKYERGGPYAGLFLFTEQARMARPVRQLQSQKNEMIGSLEQSTMHIRSECASSLFLSDAPLRLQEAGCDAVCCCRCRCCVHQLEQDDTHGVIVLCCHCVVLQFMEGVMILHRYQNKIVDKQFLV